MIAYILCVMVGAVLGFGAFSILKAGSDADDETDRLLAELRARRVPLD